MKMFFGWAAVVWLALVMLALIIGTAGGIHDNIQYKDWFSVTMWAVLGPIGFCLAGVGAVRLALKLAEQPVKS